MTEDDLDRLLSAPRKTTMTTRLPTKFAATTRKLIAAHTFADSVEPQADGSIVLPYPPSANSVFEKFNGKHMSEEYRHWRDQASYMMNRQTPRLVPGRVSISVEIVAPDNRVRDLDNVGFKAAVDCLVRHGVIEGDDSRFVREINAKWLDEGVPCRVRITSL